MDARTIKELYPQVFDWLKLQDINVYIIIILMVLVAGINMISALLIIILERTTMIGLLKAMGARNWGIRKVFLYVASSLTLRGMLLGNIVGIALCLIQKYTGLVRLSQESYYVSVVPIHFSWSGIIMVNIGTLLVCMLMLILPSIIITRISPIKAIRFN
jgi:lipoprotein-releasing system permease protein